MLEQSEISLNALAAPLVERLISDAALLRIGVECRENGCTIVDAGISYVGGIEAGRRIAEICMAGLGRVAVTASEALSPWTWQVQVSTSQPTMACLASQYAGWSLSGPAGSKFHALGSGPGRALACREPLFQELGYRDRADCACLVLEASTAPPASLTDRISSDCGIDPSGLTLILTPTGSLAGAMQIAARVVEVALHKAHELAFPVRAIVDAMGVTPVPPATPDALGAMGRTNDTILFGGQVQLYVTGSDSAAEALARALPSGSSRDYGRPFAKVFADYEYDFFKVDPMLFSPARVSVTALESGRSFHAGALDAELLHRSFSQ